MRRRSFIAGSASLCAAPVVGAGQMTTTIDIRNEVGAVNVVPATGGGVEIAAPGLDVLRISDEQASDLAAGLGDPTTPPQTSLTNKLLVNGDSIAYAVRPGVTLEQSAFQRIAIARGLTLVNTAVPGHTTTQMKAHWAADLATHNAGAVAIMMSANNSFHGVSVAQSKIDMLDMIHMAQDTGANVTIMSHPLFIYGGGGYNHNYGKHIYDMMIELAGLPSIQYVDVYSYWFRYLYLNSFNGTVTASQNPVLIPLYAPDANGNPDWLHPSAVGQDLIVEPTLKNPQACARA